jgi:hypothetical protein
MDDRGIVYVRHGKPDEVVRIAAVGNNRMAWLYRGLAGGRAVLEFDKPSAEKGVQNNYYLPDPSDARGCPGAVNRFTAARPGPFGSYVASIINFLNWEADGFDTHLSQTECYAVMAGDVGIKRNLRGVDLRKTVGTGIYQTETAIPRMKKPLVALLNSYAFRSPGGGTELWVATSVRAKDIIGRTVNDGVEYALRFFAAVEDPATHEFVRSDPDFATRRPTAFTGDDVVVLNALLHPPVSSTGTVRVAIRNQVDTLQGEVLTAPREIPAFADGTVAISDLVIAVPGDGMWTRHGIRLTPIAAHRVRAGDPFRLYYETYGVKEGEPLTISIAIQPTGATDILEKIRNLVDRKQALSVEFSERAAVTGSDVSVSTREIAADLKPGNYDLIVRVQTQTRTLTGVTTLTVVERQK